MQQAPNINYLWSSALIEELYRLGIKHFCISPGSRSTPLALSVVKQGKVPYTVCYDERSCAFMALGIAKASQAPVALITTSGSAVANLFPAVTEAALEGVPLVLLTADRPPELRNNSANQSIDQQKIFGDFVRYYFDIPCPTDAIKLKTLLSQVDRAVFVATQFHPGPVHLNCQFRDPLIPVEQVFLPKAFIGAENWLAAHRPFTSWTQELPRVLNHAERGWLVVGALKEKREQEAAKQIARQLQWPVVAQVNSGLFFEEGLSHLVYVDQWVQEPSLAKNYYPDVVLHLGGRLVSEKLYPFFEAAALKAYVQVDSSSEYLDPFALVTHRVVQSLETVAGTLTVSGSGDERAYALSKRVEAVAEGIFDKGSLLTEGQVARSIVRLIPEGSSLFLSSSMPIRDMQWLGRCDRKEISVFCNRGTSGIDGIISTAVGIAMGNREPMTLLLGDLSFLHDNNGLSLLKGVKKPFVIVVNNNGGGGIFHLMPVSQYKDLFSPVMDTPHQFEIEGLAKAFHVAHLKCSDIETFQKSYQSAFKKNESIIIEVVTDIKDSVNFYTELKHIIAKMS